MFTVRVVGRRTQGCFPQRGCWPARQPITEAAPTVVCPLCAAQTKDEKTKTAVYAASGHIACRQCHRQCKIVSESGVDLIPADLRALAQVKQLLEQLNLLKAALAGSGTLLSMITIDNTTPVEDPVPAVVLEFADIATCAVAPQPVDDIAQVT